MCPLHTLIFSFSSTRYTVQYTIDEGTQANICHEKIRAIKNSKKRKTSSKTLASSTSPKSSPFNAPANSTEESTTKRARTSMNSASVSSTPMELPVFKTTFTPNYVADTKELEMGSKMGLPEGWAVKIRPNSRYTFHSPEGERFTSKKAVYTRLGLPLPKHGYNPLTDIIDEDNSNNQQDNTDEHNDEKTAKDQKSDKADNDPTIIEDGDPPWRTSGHKLMGKRIEYTFSDGITGKGTVTGWISDTDVDKDGNPGFVSEKTDEPACLFHVTMDADCAVASQDFEEYEVEECLIDERSQED